MVAVPQPVTRLLAAPLARSTWMMALEVVALSKVRPVPPSATTQLPNGLLAEMSASPNRMMPLVNGPDLTGSTSAVTVIVVFDGMSIVVKSAIEPGPLARMPLSQLLVSLQAPPNVLVQVPFWANAVVVNSNVPARDANFLVRIFMVCGVGCAFTRGWSSDLTGMSPRAGDKTFARRTSAARRRRQLPAGMTEPHWMMQRLTRHP